MRKPSYATLAEQYRQKDHDLTLHWQALSCVSNEQPDATTTVQENTDGNTPAVGSFYRFDLYRADGAAGGILVVTFKCKGQRNTTTAHYFEDYRSQLSLCYFERIACGNLLSAVGAKHVREALARQQAAS